MIRKVLIPLALFAAAGSTAYAYELGTHGALTYEAYKRSILTDSEFVKQLGVKNGVNPFGPIYYDISGTETRERTRQLFEEDRAARRMPLGTEPLSIEGWLMRGVIREDDSSTLDNPQEDPYHTNLKRPLHHFFDPYNNRPLTAFGLSLLDPDVHTAPAWGIGTRNPFAQPNAAEAGRRNHFTVFDAREAMYRALTGRDSQGNVLQPAPGGTLTSPQDIRSAYWATMFRALGDVVHLVQDMGQPQHTRNDRHAGVLGGGPESAYEFYVDARARGVTEYKIDGTTVTPQPLDYGNYPIPSFARYSDYFSTSPGAGSLTGNGLADYSNRGFFSFGANLGSNPYSAPSNDAARYTKESATGLLPTKPSQKFNFLRGDVPDTLNPVPSANIRMTTESAFDLFLVSTPPTYSLNRHNYDDMANLLIPRAVAYSAGLVNYFFRGKIDLGTDPANPAQYVVKNLGPEPMNGRFSLYYDDTQDVRKLVRDRSGADVVWQTANWLAPESNGLLSAGAAMPVPIDFDPPGDAKVAGEYMLVFDGDMGEEKADIPNGVVGAVAGKLIKAAPYRGALYIAGLDAQNRIVSFKVDPEGLRVLNGPDVNGQIRSTPAAIQFAGQKDFDPLFPIVQSHGGVVLPKLERMKQVVFESSGLGGMSHQTVALSLRTKFGDFLAYLFNSTAGRLTIKGNTMGWLAGSLESVIGEFEFWPQVQSNGSATLAFTRRFRLAPGEPLQTTFGTIVLPVYPGAPAVDSVNYINGFKEAKVLVSPDGLTVSGFKTQSSDASGKTFWDTYDLVIALGVQPTATMVQSEHVPLNASFTPSPNNVNESTTTGPGPGPDQHFVSHTRTINNSEDSRNQRRFFVDYIANRLVAWRDRVQTTSVNEFIDDRIIDINYDPDVSCPQTRTTDRVQSHRVAHKSIETTKVVLDQVVASEVKNIAKILFGNPDNYTSNFNLHQVDFLPCGGPQQIGTPIVVDNLMYDSDAQDTNPSFTGFTLHQTLNGKVDGSILYNWARSYIGINPPATARYSIRGEPLGSFGNDFIADASPLGEIFVAKTDKSVIVYDPIKASGMPQILDIPAHIVKLVAVLWF